MKRPRRAAAFTEADINRILRCAAKAGLAEVAIELPGGVKFSLNLNQNTDIEALERASKAAAQDEQFQI